MHASMNLAERNVRSVSANNPCDCGSTGRSPQFILVLLAPLVLLLFASAAFAMQGLPGRVRSEQEISASEGGFGGALNSADRLANSAAALGDLDGDGIGELVLAAPGDDGRGGVERGAAWILFLFLRADGTVESEVEISSSRGGFG